MSALTIAPTHPLRVGRLVAGLLGWRGRRLRRRPGHPRAPPRSAQAAAPCQAAALPP